MKKLKKSLTDRRICGVCGGIAEYFDCDSTIIRIIMLCFMFCGYGFLAYFIAALLMPSE